MLKDVILWYTKGSEVCGNAREGDNTMIGALGGNRTHDPRLRRPILYPTELRAQKCLKIKTA